MTRSEQWTAILVILSFVVGLPVVLSFFVGGPYIKTERQRIKIAQDWALAHPEHPDFLKMPTYIQEEVMVADYWGILGTKPLIKLTVKERYEGNFSGSFFLIFGQMQGSIKSIEYVAFKWSPLPNQTIISKVPLDKVIFLEQVGANPSINIRWKWNACGFPKTIPNANDMMEEFLESMTITIDPKYMTKTIDENLNLK